MLESFFRRQNKADLLLSRATKVLDDKLRLKIINCVADFMVEAFGKGNPLKITKQQKEYTAQAAIRLFVGLKSNQPDNELVTKFHNTPVNLF